MGNPAAVCVMERWLDEGLMMSIIREKMEVPGDPVCGSGHCHIIPYWANRLGKTALASPRGGALYCRRAVLYANTKLKGEGL